MELEDGEKVTRWRKSFFESLNLSIQATPKSFQKFWLRNDNKSWWWNLKKPGQDILRKPSDENLRNPGDEILANSGGKFQEILVMKN